MADDVPRIVRDHEVRRYDQRPMLQHLTPVFRNIFTDMFQTPFDYQDDHICGRIELNMMKCLEAYGGNRGFKECRDYIDDFVECTSFIKSKQRIEAMRRERNRQHKAGERPIKYAVPPRMGSWESTQY